MRLRFRWMIAKRGAETQSKVADESRASVKTGQLGSVVSSVMEGRELFATSYDEGLLDQAKFLWAQGEWFRLIALDISDLEPNPDRAKLCLVVACAHLQLAQSKEARVYLDHALRWGCDKNLLSQLLVSGVHNTLGRAAAASGNLEKLNLHFREAVQGLGNGSAIAHLAQKRCENELSQIANALPVLTNDEVAIQRQPYLDETDANFYRAFENRFRGSRELIKGRVRVYLPFVQPVARRHPNLKALDLGCGRGEWLEVLAEAGITALGIDIDANMLRDCETLGVSVLQGEALATLRQQPSGSSFCISLLHVVEHMPFDVVKQVVKESKRVLVEDGILIMETPNPENYTVGSCNFYLDPSHVNPLPPQLLAFVPEYYGFERIKVLRLQEEQSLHDKASYAINDLLRGVSPDYSVLAQVKKADADTRAGQKEEFAWLASYGVSFDQMLQRNSQNNDLIRNK